MVLSVSNINGEFNMSEITIGFLKAIECKYVKLHSINTRSSDNEYDTLTVLTVGDPITTEELINLGDKVNVGTFVFGKDNALIISVRIEFNRLGSILELTSKVSDTRSVRDNISSNRNRYIPRPTSTFDTLNNAYIHLPELIYALSINKNILLNEETTSP